MTASNARVRFELQSRAENVALLRGGLSAMDVALGFGDALVTDLKTAVSEACNNVVVHAYGDQIGPMTVTVQATDEIVEVIIRDHGSGIRQISNTAGHMGLGLGVMSALADRVEFITPREGGTEVRLCFRRREEPSEDDDRIEPLERWLEEAPIQLSGDAVIWLEPVALLGSVFGRVLRSCAAASYFSADRVDGLHSVSDALAEYAARAGDGNAVGVAVSGSPRRLDLITGPFPNSAKENARSSAGKTLADLVDGFTLGQLDGLGTVRFALLDERQPV